MSYPPYQSQQPGAPIGFELPYSSAGPNAYPPQHQQQPGYPNQPPGYPIQQSGYPNQQPAYPNQQPGYPNQQAAYPTPQAPGYPSQQPNYPNQQPSYPNQQPAYPNQQPAYPNQQPAYPNQQPTYPNQQSAYPTPQAPSYPSQQQFGYPQQQAAGGYPPQQGYGAPVGNQQQTAYHQQPTYGGQQQPQQMAYQGTIRPNPNFSAQDDAKALKKAMKGFGTDNKTVLSVLCRRTASERHQIAIAFKTMYGKDLITELKSELSGDFEDVCVALLRLPAEYDAMELRHAMQGVGTDEADLIEIMCTRTNAEIQEIKMWYRKLYGTDLENNLKSETSYYFKRLMVSMCTGGRDESTTVNQQRAKNDAVELHNAGVKKVGTDESAFIAILAMQNTHQLQYVFNEYRHIAGHEIEQAIQREFSGDIQRGLLTLVACARSTPGFFAQRARQAMAGMGTHDRDLIRVCITRADKDMVQVKQEYQRLYKQSLEQAISSETSGNYKQALLTLIQ